MDDTNANLSLFQKRGGGGGGKSRMPDAEHDSTDSFEILARRRILKEANIFQ